MSKYDKFSKEELLALVEKQDNELSSKKYGLVWDSEREPEQVVLDCEHNLPVLKRVKGKEIKESKNQEDNILIEGDNYHALTVLNYTHQEKIDVIYIDPPYNTKSEGFLYNDKRVDINDGYRHSKWLNFMEKRLNIAKSLLKEDGVCFISIDDNEFSQLKMLCDKIFNESNYIETFHIQVRYASKSLNEKDNFQKLIEYALCYAKNKDEFLPNKPSSEYDINKFKYKIIEKKKGTPMILGKKKVLVFKKGEYEIIEEKVGSMDLLKATWASGSVLKGNTSGKFFHNYIETRKETDGLEVLYKVDGIGDDGIGYRYFTGPKRENATKGIFYTGIPLSRREEIENEGSSLKERPITNFYDLSGDFGNIRQEGGVGFRGGKKPIKLLKEFINFHKNKNITVLDFFAGSGSTGHAVIDLNSNDGGNRKFILCTDDNEKICTDYCYPRLKNVIKGFDSVNGLGGNLQYFETSLIKKTKNKDQMRLDLTQKCTEMLCVKENIFNLEIEKEDYKIFFSNKGDNFLCVYYNMFDESFKDFLKEIKKLKGQKKIYMFSIDGRVDRTLFKGINDCNIEEIPQKIIEVYKQLIKMNIPVKSDTIFIEFEKANKKIFGEKEKDESARILRIVIEKTIQKIAQKNNISIFKDNHKEEKISVLNDKLKENKVFNQVKWEENKTYLTIGNNASHGDYDEYTLTQIENFYRHIQLLFNDFGI